MPHIIPIRDLKNTSDVSQMCHKLNEPVFITKNGYGDMVIMSMDAYEKNMFINDVFKKLSDGEKSIAKGEALDARESLRKMREEYGI